MDIVHQHQLQLVPHTVTIGYQHMSMEQVLKVRQRVSEQQVLQELCPEQSQVARRRPCRTEPVGCSQSSCMWSAGTDL